MSFKRSDNSFHSRRLPSTRSWINNQNLVSFGLRELDSIFGGGIALGSLLLIEEDKYSNYAESLYFYCIAESICSSAETLIVSPSQVELTKLLSSLPFNLSHERNISQIPPPDISKSTEDTGLKIAWQYEKYLNSGTFYF